MAQHDCLYRNMYSHDRIVIIDTDEIIKPGVAGWNWQEMLDALKRRLGRRSFGQLSSVQFRHVYAFTDSSSANTSNDNSPNDSLSTNTSNDNHHTDSSLTNTSNDNNLPILSRSYRSSVALTRQVKSILNPRRVVQITTHKAKVCLSGPCKNHLADGEIGLLMHFRDGGCVRDISLADCKRLTEARTFDPVLTDDKGNRKKVMHNIIHVLRKLDLLKKDFQGEELINPIKG